MQKLIFLSQWEQERYEILWNLGVLWRLELQPAKFNKKWIRFSWEDGRLKKRVAVVWARMNERLLRVIEMILVGSSLLRMRQRVNVTTVILLSLENKLRMQSILYNYNLYGNCPKVERRWSEREINSRINGMMSSSSIRTRWMWHTAIEFRRVSVIVVLSHVFSLRSALKLLSASADEAGETIRSLTRMQTMANSPRTSGIIWRNSDTASLTASIL